MQERKVIYDAVTVKEMRLGLSELARYRDGEQITSLWGGFQDIKTRELYVAFDAFGAPDVVVGDVIKVFGSFLQATNVTKKDDYLVVSTVKTTEPIPKSGIVGEKLLNQLAMQQLANADQQQKLVELVTEVRQLITAGAPLNAGALREYQAFFADNAGVRVLIQELLYAYLVG